MQVLLEQVISAYVMRVIILAVIENAKRSVGDKLCRAVRQRAFPEDSVRAVFEALVEETVLSENVQPEAALATGWRFLHCKKNEKIC